MSTRLPGLKLTGNVHVTFVNSKFNGESLSVTEPFVLNNERPFKEIKNELPEGLKDQIEREYADVEFHFTGTTEDACKLIEKACSEIEIFVDKLYQELQ